MGKILVAGEMHQDNFYKTPYLSDLCEGIASDLWKYLRQGQNPDHSQIRDIVRETISRSPKKNPGVLYTIRGGNGNNSAELLARLGVPVQLATVIGRGSEWMVPQLHDLGIDTSAVFQKDEPAPISTVIEDPAFTKMFVTPQLKKAMNFDGVDLPGNLLDSVDIFFSTPVDFKFAPLLRQASKAGIFTTFTIELQKITEYPALEECVDRPMDLFFANLADCAQIAQIPPPTRGNFAGAGEIDRKFRKFARIRVYTLGAAGSLVYFRDQGPLEIPIFAVEVANRSGAGDSFAAGFLAKLYESFESGGDPRDLDNVALEGLLYRCGKNGAAAAALKISQNRPPDKVEMAEFLEAQLSSKLP